MLFASMIPSAFLELTIEILGDRGMDVDVAGFEDMMEAQRRRARAAREQTGYLGDDDSIYVWTLHREFTTESRRI